MEVDNNRRLLGLMKIQESAHLREKIHALSHELMSFRQENREPEDWDRFYSSTDTLLDMDTALADFFRRKRKASLLEKVGFLQALTNKQNALKSLCTSIQLEFDPHKVCCLRFVREMRDRIAGHPAWSDKSKRKFKYKRSSAMLDLSSDYDEGIAVIFYMASESKSMHVPFESLMSFNEHGITRQMKRVLSRMNELEQQYITQIG